MQLCGQEIPQGIIERIRSRVQGDEALTRTALSREVAGWLDWRDPHGQVKEMSCRVALLKLERRGLIALPPARPVSFTQCRSRTDPALPLVAGAATLAELGPIELVGVDDARGSRAWRQLMSQHPLGGGPLCGAQLRYLVRCAAGYLGALSFSAAAWRLAARDAYIGWDDATRASLLGRVVNNSRFLILPSVEVPNLASHVLALAEQRLARDWQARYGVRPVLLETFVDSTRYQGTCYRAANWIEVGTTRGRGRQDRTRSACTAAKRILLRPLSRDWREQLVGPGQSVAIAAGPRPTPADWAEQEFGAAKLHDGRLQRRLLTLARDFYARPSANVPQACGSRAATKAAYRFFDHPDTTMDTLLASHYEATGERIAKEPVVLAVQDTTSLNYTAHEATEGLGAIGTRADGPQGLLVHSTLAFNPQGTPLGFIDVQCWARDPSDFGKRARRASTPIEQKESNKWLKSYRAAAAIAARHPRTQVVSVGDREADVYELFELAASTPHGPRLLIRAERNRQLLGEQERLWPTMQSQPVAAEQLLELPRQGSRPKRQAHLEIRFASLTLCAPKQHAGKSPIAVWAVLAQERNAPAGVKPLEWMLLTTVPLTSAQQAAEKLQWYAQRWGIEVMHRTLKSGCRIEDRQLGNADRLEACLAIDLVVAWRICHLTQLGRDVPQAPCTVHFEQVQWQSLMIFTERNPVPPKEPPTLREAILRVAALGGFLGRKSDGQPGAECLWRGLQRLDDITQACRFFLERAPQRPVSSRRGSG
jgi:hypothetical protein